MKYEVISEVRYAGDLVTVVHLARGYLGTVSEGTEIPHVVPVPKERVERRKLGVWVQFVKEFPATCPRSMINRVQLVRPSLGSQIAQNSAMPDERMH
jgi:hypothetical protein